MGASRKLQGEIDRVLKKVQEGVDVFESIWNKVYDTENMNQKEKFEADLKKEIKKLQRYRDQIKTWLQSSEIKDKRALMDARKQIEREMERFKICEKETKTKAFSKEGLVQQPKTDPKEKAKSETRDWLNTVVSDLESQIDSFEAELEALSVKKGKTRPPRSTHLEASITRNKAHIMKLELILRLLDNDELSPEQVNDVKDFLEDYVERNQDDFEEFSDVDELYSTLPLDKVESLEDRVAIGTSALVKGVGSLPTASTVLGLKSSISGSATQPSSVSAATPSQGASPQDQTDETTSQDSNSDLVSKTPLSKVGMTVSAGFSTTHGTTSVTGPVPNLLSVTGSLGLRGMPSAATAPAVLPNPGSIRVPIENSSTTTSVTHATNSKEDNVNLLSRRPSPAPSEIGMGKGVGRSSLVGSVSTSAPINSLSSVSIAAIPGSGALGTMSMASDTAKRNSQGADDKSGTTNLPKSLLSPLNNKLLLQQITKSSDAIGSTDASNTGEGTLTGGRVFSASAISGVQWRPQTANLFHNQNETVQIRGRTELPPDHREKYLQRLLQVQQQGASNHFNMSHLSGTSQKQFLAQQSSLLQQLNSQSSSLSSFGLGIPPPGLSHVPSISQQQTNSVQQLSQQSTHSSAPKDIEIGQVKIEEQQHLSNSAEDLMDEPSVDSALNSVPIEDDMKPSYTAASNPTADANLLPRETDLSPGQPLQSNQTASNLGVIGRRSALDLGKVSDNIVEPVTHHAGVFEHNLQMLEAAYYRLPQPKDSERPKAYIPRHPTVTPSSYPQVPLPIFDKPAFWERLSLENVGADTLFYTFYYQQNSYQQYLAARELKRQSWRYHKKYNTWFQRHEEPKITTDDYEQGTYVYFDFHITDDGLQHGWCQRIKTDFRFEYNYLEDELVV